MKGVVRSLATCSLALITTVLLQSQAWAAVDQAALRAEAARFGITITFTAGPTSQCQSTACWVGPGQIYINLAKASVQTPAVLIDFVRHEAAHDRIYAICHTVFPSISAGSKYHQGNGTWVENAEYVADMYAWRYYGLSLTRPNAWYAMDPLVTAAERSTFDYWAQQINGSSCGQKIGWIDANGDGLPDDWGMSPSQTDMNGDGLPDIVGFSDTTFTSPGVQVSLNQGGSFAAAKTWSTNFALGPRTSSSEYRWTYEYPRVIVDVNKDGFPDIVSFGDQYTSVELNNKNGTFNPWVVVSPLYDFSAAQGWETAKHPRMVVDVNQDGYPDIIGFGYRGVYVALNDRGTGFKPATLWLNDFGYDAGGWRVDKHPRMVVDVNNDGYPDIVGFGTLGVLVALNDRGTGFKPSTLWLNDFGYDAGGWRVDKHPRMVVDVNNDGYPDIVGFGTLGVLVALNNHGTGFKPAPLWLNDFGYDAGGWRVDKHPRMVVDVNKDGYPDIVGFGTQGVLVALNDRGTGFKPAPLWLNDFGYEGGGWRVDLHPRTLTDINGDGYPDIVGFASRGVVVALNDRGTGFKPGALWLSDMGYYAGNWHVDQHPRMIR